MKRRILSVSLLALIAGPAVAADVRLDSYRHPQNERFREFNRLYLDGVRAGLMAYNARLKTHGGQLAFCMPDNLVLTAGKSQEIMLRSADQRSAKGNMLVSILLLSGLTDEFPCENPLADRRKVGREKARKIAVHSFCRIVGSDEFL